MWVEEQRSFLGLDQVPWDEEKPLEYYAKANPTFFLKPMWLVLQLLEAAGAKRFSLLPMW